MLRAERVSGLIIKQGGPNRRSLRSGGRRREEKADEIFFPLGGVFSVYIHDTPRRSSEVRGGYCHGTHPFSRPCAF
jgi:hypothetical protein